MIKLSVGYPNQDASEDMVKRFLEGQLHDETKPVLTGEDINEMRKQVNAVSIKDNLRRYAVEIVEATRTNPEIACGASPRALLSLLRCAQALAFMADRDYCIPEDIAEAATLTLTHRIILTSEARLSRTTKEYLVRRILEQVRCNESSNS